MVRFPPLLVIRRTVAAQVMEPRWTLALNVCFQEQGLLPPFLSSDHLQGTGRQASQAYRFISPLQAQVPSKAS